MDIQKEQRIKLESMQIKGIRRLIWSNIDEDKIQSRLLTITNQSKINDLKKFLNKQNRSTLIKLIEKSSEISEQMIDEAYEQYRYGLKPGFTLFWAKNHNDMSLSDDEISDRIKDYINVLQYVQEAKYKDLCFVSLIRFGETIEITLSYLERFNYVNEEGEFSYIYMMKECFVWLNLESSFIAINNMPNILMQIVKTFFHKLYGVEITNIKATNSLLKEVFDDDKTKRISKRNTNPPENQLEKVVFADPNLSEKQNCIPMGYEDYEVINTQYIEDIDENTSGTLGVNCNRGKFYLSKSLTSTQFRNWSTKRIEDIIGYYKNLSELSLENIKELNMFSSNDWKNLSSDSIEILNEIVYALVSCKKSHVNSFPFSFDSLRVYLNLNKCFIEKIAPICDACEESVVAYCPSCNRSNLSITKKSPIKVICSNCGKDQQDDFTFECEKGHNVSTNNISDFLELISKEDFFDKIVHTINIYYKDICFEKNEYFVISSSSLQLCKSPSYEKLNPSDIIEFSDITNRQSLSKDNSELENILKNLKEKCGSTTNQKCANCKYINTTSIDDICILKLFEEFEGFTLQPHQGHEFGDVSMLVTVNGIRYSFLGIAKSNGNNKKVTKSSAKGREIVQQSIDSLNDGRAEIIGIIYPGLLDDQLKYLLLTQAKLQNKKMVILDYDFMIRLLDKYLESHNL